MLAIEDTEKPLENMLPILMMTHALRRNGYLLPGKFFSTIDPTPGCIGSPCYPFYTSPKPAWFENEGIIKLYC